MAPREKDHLIMKKRSISFTTALTILFVILKLTGAIAWSWTWVLCPTWIPMALGLILLAFAGLLAAPGAVKANLPQSKEREMYARMAERSSRDSFRKYLNGNKETARPSTPLPPRNVQKPNASFKEYIQGNGAPVTSFGDQRNGVR